MGVDITFFAEQRMPDGDWAIAGDLVPNPEYCPDDPDFANEPKLIPPHSKHSTMLASIRDTRQRQQWPNTCSIRDNRSATRNPR